jgi:hypothetical protein
MKKHKYGKILRGELYYEAKPLSNLVKNANQHFYFLSDEEIKEGDWYFDGTNVRNHYSTNIIKQHDKKL